MANPTGDIFLARTEEQKRFREILHELIGSRLARSLPTLNKLAKRLQSEPEPEPTEPFICVYNNIARLLFDLGKPNDSIRNYRESI